MDATAICVRDLMRTDVVTTEETASLVEVARKMRDLDVSSLVVERKNERDALGMITRKDVVEALVSAEGGESALLAGDVMTKPALSVSPDVSIALCMQMMRMVGVRRMPVVDGNRLVGILSNTDVFRHWVAALD
ncbi:MAG: CBS domain-containing protein [Candidatus Hydrogenedentes bacterium]|nr:CBS domain-containing protein [Candidatus Hydrogenedentota bacterium]